MEERRGEEKEDRAGEEEEWVGKRGANAECWEVAERLSVNGSLEKRSSRTIYILSMRQNYIIAHTRNHTAHTPDWDLEGRGDGGKRKATDRQRKRKRYKKKKKEKREKKSDMKWFESHWYGMFPAKERTACFLFSIMCVRVHVCAYNLLEISCSGWNYLHVLLSRGNQAQKCNVHVDKTGGGLRMCAHTHSSAALCAQIQADQNTFSLDSELFCVKLFYFNVLYCVFSTRENTHSDFWEWLDEP